MHGSWWIVPWLSICMSRWLGIFNWHYFGHDGSMMTLCIWCMFYLGFYTRCLQYIGLTHRALQLRHNKHDGFSNHQPRDCLLKRLFRRRSKKNHSSASLAFLRGIHRWHVNSPHKWPVTRKMFPFDDVIMRPSDAYTCQWTVPSLVRTMACRLVGARLLSQHTLAYC